MAERTAILIDKEGNAVGTASNPLYVGGFVVVGSFVDLTDVNWINPSSGDYVGWDEETQTFIPKPMSGEGLGDVTGPDGAVTRSIALYEDTTGKRIFDSPVTIDGLGQLDMHGARILDLASPVVSSDPATKGYVDQYLQGISWQLPVISILAASPADPVDGDRYIIADTAAGDWIGHEDNIATWWAAGLDWVYTVPGEGYAAYNNDTDTIWAYNATVGHWVNIGTSGVPEAPVTGLPYARRDSAWEQTQEFLFAVGSYDQIFPIPSTAITEHVQLCDAESGSHPHETVWPEVEIYKAPNAEIYLRSLDPSFQLDDAIDLVTPRGTLTVVSFLEDVLPVDVASWFDDGFNTVHLRSYSTQPGGYMVPEMYLFVTPGGTRDIIPRTIGTGHIGTASQYWEEIHAAVVNAKSKFTVDGADLSYLHVNAASEDHTHSVASISGPGFLPQLSGDENDFLDGSGVFRTIVASPSAHAESHVTGGWDIIANVVAGGNSGLMSGSDKTKLDGIAAGAEVNVNADWNATEGDAQILNKPTIPSEYVLPTATDTVLGGVKIGARLSIVDSVLSADVQGGTGSGGQYLVQRSLEGEVYETTLMYWVAPASCTVASAEMYLKSPGALNKVQAMKNGTLETDSIFASDVAMQIASTDTPVNGVYFAYGALDSGRTSLVKGDRIEFRVNQADAGAADLLVQLRCTIN